MSNIGQSVDITVCGRTYTVRPTFRVLVRTEAKIGPLFKLVRCLKNDDGLTAEQIAAILHQAVAGEPNAPRYQAIYDAITSDMDSLSDALNQAARVLEIGFSKPKDTAALEGGAESP